ncbi:uncharacterized protein EV420DRAFT_860874 [Desarmillaria tabescens]|uniref:Uncharacterized protein n=1 Tax=Armillaria tabescens TaxID=1929756 RepID=A0AA39JSP5_ARMTA|nr:uncharacterized protein EV420DRAFT_860874 [Desarmillaria tabescens]KAK0447807.1 hypothetical protein EV420DRAFT_860874 [Desarmillaria tabescens]
MSRNQRRRRLVIPSSVFTEIARYLHPDVTEGGQAALASMTLVSRKVHKAMDRELYVAPRLTSIMQWVLFLETLRRTGDPYIMRRVRRLYLTSPTSGFRYRYATRDAAFVPIATDVLSGCTNVKHLTVTYHPRLMPIIDASRELNNISSLCVIGSTLFDEAFFGQNALADIFLNPAHPSSFPSVTSLTIVKCSYVPGSYDPLVTNGHHNHHLQSLRIIDAELCQSTFTFLLQPCLATLTTLVLRFAGQPGHHINGRTFKEQLQSLTLLRHLTIIGWNEGRHPYEWAKGLMDDVVGHLPHLDTLSFGGHLATPHLFTVMAQPARLWKRLSVHEPALITPLQLLPLGSLQIETVEVKWCTRQIPEWDETKAAIKTLLYPTIVRDRDLINDADY